MGPSWSSRPVRSSLPGKPASSPMYPWPTLPRVPALSTSARRLACAPRSSTATVPPSPSSRRRSERLLPTTAARARPAPGPPHAQYGVEDEHDGTVGTVLLSTLRAGLGDALNREAEEAWA